MSDQDTAKSMLSELLSKMGYADAAIETSELEGGDIGLNIQAGEDSGRLIGRAAEGLNSIQYILNRILYTADKSISRCVVDIDGYRARRTEQIQDQAREAAEKVKEKGSPVAMPAMNAAERRLVHHALEEDPGVTTFSENTDRPGMKKVIVEPAG